MALNMLVKTTLDFVDANDYSKTRKQEQYTQNFALILYATSPLESTADITQYISKQQINSGTLVNENNKKLFKPAAQELTEAVTNGFSSIGLAVKKDLDTINTVFEKNENEKKSTTLKDIKSIISSTDTTINQSIQMQQTYIKEKITEILGKEAQRVADTISSGENVENKAFFSNFLNESNFTLIMEQISSNFVENGLLNVLTSNVIIKKISFEFHESTGVFNKFSEITSDNFKKVTSIKQPKSLANSKGKLSNKFYVTNGYLNIIVILEEGEKRILFPLPPMDDSEAQKATVSKRFKRAYFSKPYDTNNNLKFLHSDIIGKLSSVFTPQINQTKTDLSSMISIDYVIKPIYILPDQKFSFPQGLYNYDNYSSKSNLIAKVVPVEVTKEMLENNEKKNGRGFKNHFDAKNGRTRITRYSISKQKELLIKRMAKRNIKIEFEDVLNLKPLAPYLKQQLGNNANILNFYTKGPKDIFTSLEEANTESRNLVKPLELKKSFIEICQIFETQQPWYKTYYNHKGDIFLI